ncbi:class I SAM-dependent methyltransferase [Candidatus Ruminimicrobium bovinum]|uniref:class I SAM-dependent methyltransferase n=1 Tax=Candidatus Ruminimicrobium bovinum TaxID=3242779 RepID=UPI0039B89E7C
MLKKMFFANTRKPKGFLGKLMINRMNKGHANLSDWGLAHLKNINPLQIADLGCGGGINVAKLIKLFPNAKVTGFDYSKVSVKESQKVNDKEIKKGICSIVQGDVSKMPFENETFDIITAFETIYFWPGPLTSFKEVFRILKTGGTFMIVNEFDGVSEREKKYEQLIDGLKLYSQQELIDYLKQAGFINIILDHNIQKHWLTVLANK